MIRVESYFVTSPQCLYLSTFIQFEQQERERVIVLVIQYDRMANSLTFLNLAALLEHKNEGCSGDYSLSTTPQS